MENPWDLYDTPGWNDASQELEAAWNRAAKQQDARTARCIVENAMRKYAEWGALDTEPRAELRARISKTFGKDLRP